MAVCRAVLSEPRRIELEHRCIRDKIIGRQSTLMLEQRVVHVPEAPLRAGRFGSFGSELSVMHRGERKVTKCNGSMSPSWFSNAFTTG